MISIWFFIGVSLLVNGALILAAGIYQMINPPADPGIVLFSLHANVWWGAVLFVELALAGIADALAPRAANVHFEDTLEEGRLLFDYRLRPGVVSV